MSCLNGVVLTWVLIPTCLSKSCLRCDLFRTMKASSEAGLLKEDGVEECLSFISLCTLSKSGNYSYFSGCGSFFCSV